MTDIVPASLIFDDRDLSHYLRWQLQQDDIPADRQGDLPDAFEYADFLQWRQMLRGIQERQRRLYAHIFREAEGELAEVEKRAHLHRDGWTLASNCKHPIHPAHPYLHSLEQEEEEGEIRPPVVRCPVCIVRAHLDYVKLLMQKWSAVGGPWRKVDQGKDHGGLKYALLRLMHQKAKTALVSTIYAFQDWADMETNWEAQHPGSNIDVVEPYTAKAAVALFQAESDTAEWATSDPRTPGDPKEQDDDGQLSPNPQHRNTPKGKEEVGKKKQLSFSPETADTRSRSNIFFRRSSPAYDGTSQHSCADEEGWQDTSFLHDYKYNISQCRILLVVWDPNADPEMSYIDLNEGEDKGENEHVTRLLNVIDQYAETLESETRREYLQQCASTSDIFIVYKEDFSPGNDFDNFMSTPSLVGTSVEEYARSIGDIEEDAFAQ
jgi:hypothetical protein